jgi:hypothetical protein
MSRLLTCSLIFAAACGGQKPAPARPAPSNTAQVQPETRAVVAHMDPFRAVLTVAAAYIDTTREGVQRERAALERDLLEAEHDRAELTDERVPATREAMDDGDDDGVGK